MLAVWLHTSRCETLSAMDEAPILQFASFRLDPVNQQLWRDSERLEIRPKTFQFLLYLARNPQRLISREELLANVWDAAPAAEGLLRVYSFELRHLLGDDAKHPRILETLNRRGYRFLPRVSSCRPDGTLIAGESDGSLAAAQPPAEAHQLESDTPSGSLAAVVHGPDARVGGMVKRTFPIAASTVGKGQPP